MFKHIFGPVPSRRLGISLGVDLVEVKTCNFDCIYCECGKTTKFYDKRDKYVEKNRVILEIKEVLKNLKPDYITFSGAGEPTLNIELGDIIDEVRTFYQGKIAVITNSTLLEDERVRKDLEKADLIMPSLDAVSQDVFNEINRPLETVRIESIVKGLSRFIEESTKKINIEIFIVEGINDKKEELDKFVEILRDKELNAIQLNTLARPGVIKDIKPTTIKRLGEIKDYFEKNNLKNVEIIKKYTSRNEVKQYNKTLENLILSMLNKRKYSVDEISELLQNSKEELFKYLNILEKEGKVKIFIKNNDIYVKS